MSRMSHRGLAVIAGCLDLSVTLAGVPGDMAMYVGGTIPDLEEKTEGKLSTSSPTAMAFQAK